MMSTQLREGLVRAAAETEITRRLQRGEPVLLVGAKPTNLPQALVRHPQVDLWDSEGPRNRAIPARTRIVLFTKWVGHNQHRAIREDAARDEARFVWPELLGTGEIRRLLQPLIAEAHDDEPVVEAAPAPVVALTCDCGLVPGVGWGGSTREFVELHWQHDHDGSNGWQAREAERLHRLAGQHGLSTSMHYLQTLVSQLNAQRGQQARDEERLSRERAHLAAQAVEQAAQDERLRHLARPTGAVEVSVETRVEVPAPTPQALAASESRTTAELSELLRMIDDATAVLGLARETLVQLSKDNADQAALRDRLRARVRAALDEAI